MDSGAVAGMALKSVIGELNRQTPDQGITGFFCQNTGSGDGRTAAIASNNGLLRRGQRRNGNTPSTSTNSGLPGKRCKARSMANSVARRMPKRSISRADAWPSPQASTASSMSGTRRARRRAVRALLSVNPSDRSTTAAGSETTTAPAKTGPNQQPRPTSSTPASKACIKVGVSVSNSSRGTAATTTRFLIAAFRLRLRRLVDSSRGS